MQLLKRNKLLVFILLAALISRIIFLPKWLEDWDSVQFVMALHNFDIGQNLPHAPGYPLYVLLGKIFLLFTRNDTLALSLVSTTTSVISGLFLYLIAKSMFNEKVGYIATIIFFLTPISWLMSISALTNIPGLFSFLIFAYFLYVKKGKSLVIPSILGGFILGMRFTEIPIIISLIATTFFQKPNIKELMKIIISFLIGVSLWMVPMILVTGWESFISSYSWITNYVINHDSVVKQAIPLQTLLKQRLVRIEYLMSIGYSTVFTIIGILSLILIYLNKHNWSKYQFQFLFVWLISYLVPLIFFYNLEVTRYTLPLLPPIAILTSFALNNLSLSNKKNYILQIPFFIIITILLVSITKLSMGQVKAFKETTPPSISPVVFVKENFDPNNTLVNVSYTFRQFEYYAPEFRSLYEKPLLKTDLLNKKYVVIDYIGLQDKMPEDSRFTIIETKEFSGNKDIHTRLSKVNLYILEIDNGQDK